MTLTEGRKKSMYKYARENLKRVPLDLTKDLYGDVKNHAQERGESVNGFIKRAISETMERDNSAQVESVSAGK